MNATPWNIITQKRLHIILFLRSSTTLWALHYKITTLYYVYIEFTKKCADTSLLFISSYDGILCLNRPFSVVHTIEHVHCGGVSQFTWKIFSILFLYLICFLSCRCLNINTHRKSDMAYLPHIINRKFKLFWP